MKNKRKKVTKKKIGNNNIFKRQSAITLIALIVSIIIMLILAGVSLSALVGNNGILSNATKASLESKYVNYKEELETKTVMNYNESSGITVTKSLIKNYISSMKDEDLEKFAIVQGKLCYIGNDEEERKVAESVRNKLNRRKCRRCNSDNKCARTS